jgi:DGQHR domain-containing protein
MAKRKKARRREPIPEELEKRNHRKDIRSVFRNSGFTKVLSVSDKEFTFKGRTGDMDDVFVYENIIVLAEYTCASTKKLSHHLLPKKTLFDHIIDNKKEFIEFFEENFETFKETRDHKYTPSQCELVILYCSKNKLENKHKKQLPYVKFFDYPILQYFLSISKIIKKSSRFELFNFFGLKYDNIGENVLKPSTGKSEEYGGHILPEEHSSFEENYKVVSFYMDAESLIDRAYVLRKEGWKNADGLYQRMIVNTKITKMREYLDKQNRVFVNNIIVTLPNEKTKLLDEQRNTVEASTFNKTRPVTIQIEEGFNLIGLVDGQHRVYAYHEGNDKYEEKISRLRKIQNLLVTGIIYPEGLEDNKRLEFEAKLFLEINANQTGAKSDLKQAIQLLLEPFSTIAVAKSVISMLNNNGPLETYLAEYFFDKGKVPTTSIVSYGLTPIVKRSGEDSLFKLWKNPNKKELTKGIDHKLLQEYREFCTEEINTLLIAYRKNIPNNLWTTNKKISKFLTVTSINGLINCLRLLIENDKTNEIDYYQEKLKKISEFKFEDYKSSQYRALGKRLYDEFFS